MIYIIYKILVFLQITWDFYELPEITWNHLNYHEDNVFKHFFKNYHIFSFLKKNKYFFHNTIKSIRNNFKLKKENKAIKGRTIWKIENIFE